MILKQTKIIQLEKGGKMNNITNYLAPVLKAGATKEEKIIKLTLKHITMQDLDDKAPIIWDNLEKLVGFEVFEISIEMNKEFIAAVIYDMENKSFKYIKRFYEEENKIVTKEVF